MAIPTGGRRSDHPISAAPDAGGGSGGRSDDRPAAGGPRRRDAGLELYAPGALKPSPNWYIRGSYLGRRIYQSAGTSRRQDAERELRRIQREIEDGRFLSRAEQTRALDARPTFGQAAARYLEDCPLSEVGRVRRLVLHFGDTPLDGIDSAAVRRAAEALYPGKSAGTRNREAIGPAAAVLHQAADLGHIPWPRIRRLKEPKGRTPFISPADAARFLEAADPPRLALLALFLLSTSCRLGEALSLTPASIDLERQTAHFPATKNGDARTAYLPAPLASSLANRMGQARSGQPLLSYRDRFAVRREWNRIRDKLGLAGFTPHICRHTAATWARQSGADTRFLMEAFGWRDAKFIARNAHVDASREIRDGVNKSAVANLPIVVSTTGK